MGGVAAPAKVENPLQLEGIEFVEFAAPKPELLHKLFLEFGFSRLKRHKTRKVDYYRQNDIHLLLNFEPNSAAGKFAKMHGPSLCSMGWKFSNPKDAVEKAIARGARRAVKADYSLDQTHELPAISGIGDSLIYFTPSDVSADDFFAQLGFVDLQRPDVVKDRGFQYIDHLTNNVHKGTMTQWSDFYKKIFGFYEIRYFDIRGAKTGLTSYALRSPDGSFCIPINEGTEAKSQINEYLEEYHGPGVQHLAFATNDIIHSVRSLKGTSIETLDIDDEYYQEVFQRVPNVTEDKKALQDLCILVDGNAEGYLLQIFTKNVVGPIFIEIIQRKNNLTFGEGNFSALFRSIERDQMKRGYLK